ncbi:tensin-2-like [Chlamydotis macqueenii]
MKPPGAIRSLLRGLGRRDGTDTPPTPHTFREKAFRRGGACAACHEPLGPQGLVCRVCKVTSHEHCQAKVPGPCQAAPPPERAGPGRGKPRPAAPPPPRPLQRRNTAPVGRGEHMGSSWSLNGTRQCGTLTRPPPEPELSLSHVTERILCLRFPRRLPPGRHRWHLRGLARALAGRHHDRYTIFNLSEPREDLARLNPRVQEFGWPDGHAPHLEQLCAVCRALEGWLGAHPHNVAVLHCRGCKGKAGVVVAAYMHYSQASASADQALAALTMRKFCEERLGAELQPSQRRYVAHFAALLSGRVRMNSSPRFLHHVLLPPLPGCQPFLKIYQALQLIYTSAVYSAPGPQGLCISLEPALLLKGDVMVKCYRWLGGARRRALFRAQFHTGALLSPRLQLRWAELDQPCSDESCPPDARVELLFSSGPASTGCPSTRCPPAVPVRLAGGEPALRWDSYEGLGLRHEDSAEERRSPGEGGSWPETPEGPSSSPRCPAPPPASSGTQGRGPGTPPPCSHPLLPEKRRPPAPGGPRDGAAPEAAFAQDTSRFWYKPGLSRDRAVALLKEEPPGSFLVRESRSCPGAFGLALRVPAPPSGTRSLPHGTGDPREQLVRHFLIESGPRGVRVRGCREEPQFGSLPALVLHHSISPISLPCALRLPGKDPLEETGGRPASPSVSTAAELLRQGAACSVLLLGSVDTEALTGPQALAKATGTVLGGSPAPRPCLVHFRVSAQGITLTDNQRRLFFRRHYPVSSVTYCNTDPKQRRWANEDGTTSTIFGFVAKKAGGVGEGNACHVFAEHDPEQPATAIVTFVTRVMLGTRRA